MATISVKVWETYLDAGNIKINDRPEAKQDQITCYVGDTVRLEAILLDAQNAKFVEWSDRSEDTIRNIVVTEDLSLIADFNTIM